MRHRKSGRRLGRNSSHRKAMLRNMVTSLLQHGHIQTTDTRAKEVRRLAEKIITMGKKGLPGAFDEGTSEEEMQARRLHLFRQVLKVVRTKEVARSVMGDLAERYSERPGGYTRIIKLGFRRGDNSPLSLLQLVDSPIDVDTDEDSDVEEAPAE